MKPSKMMLSQCGASCMYLSDEVTPQANRGSCLYFLTYLFGRWGALYAMKLGSQILLYFIIIQLNISLLKIIPVYENEHSLLQWTLSWHMLTKIKQYNQLASLKYSYRSNRKKVVSHTHTILKRKKLYFSVLLILSITCTFFLHNNLISTRVVLILSL